VCLCDEAVAGQHVLNGCVVGGRRKPQIDVLRVARRFVLPHDEKLSRALRRPLFCCWDGDDPEVSASKFAIRQTPRHVRAGNDGPLIGAVRLKVHPLIGVRSAATASERRPFIASTTSTALVNLSHVNLSASMSLYSTRAPYKLLHYVAQNANRIDYPRYRARGIHVGSCAMESFHRVVSQMRLKLASGE
jgi:hypothetical protein